MTPPVARDPSLRVPGTQPADRRGLRDRLVLRRRRGAVRARPEQRRHHLLADGDAADDRALRGDRRVRALGRAADERRAARARPRRAGLVAARRRPRARDRGRRARGERGCWSRSCTPRASRGSLRTRRGRPALSAGHRRGARVSWRSRWSARSSRSCSSAACSPRPSASASGRSRTALLTAALFALAHVLPRVIPPIFILGLALAFVYERVGSTLPGHAGSLPVQRNCASPRPLTHH